MELKIKNATTSEDFVLNINVTENQNETINHVTFLDKRLSEKYGTIEIVRKENNFWKFPDKADNYLMSIVSQIIFQLMSESVK